MNTLLQFQSILARDRSTEETRRCRHCGRFYSQVTGKRIESPFLSVNVASGLCARCYREKIGRAS